MKRTIGLREIIRDARDLSEIEALLQESTSYVAASKKTRRRWQSTAARRIAELAK